MESLSNFYIRLNVNWQHLSAKRCMEKHLHPNYEVYVKKKQQKVRKILTTYINADKLHHQRETSCCSSVSSGDFLTTKSIMKLFSLPPVSLSSERVPSVLCLLPSLLLLFSSAQPPSLVSVIIFISPFSTD